MINHKSFVDLRLARPLFEPGQSTSADYIELLFGKVGPSTLHVFSLEQIHAHVPWLLSPLVLFEHSIIFLPQHFGTDLNAFLDLQRRVAAYFEAGVPIWLAVIHFDQVLHRLAHASLIVDCVILEI